MLPDGMTDGQTDSQTYGRVTPKQHVYLFTANNKTVISPTYGTLEKLMEALASATILVL